MEQPVNLLSPNLDLQYIYKGMCMAVVQDRVCSCDFLRTSFSTAAILSAMWCSMNLSFTLS